MQLVKIYNEDKYMMEIDEEEYIAIRQALSTSKETDHCSEFLYHQMLWLSELSPKTDEESEYSENEGSADKIHYILILAFCLFLTGGFVANPEFFVNLLSGKALPKSFGWAVAHLALSCLIILTVSVSCFFKDINRKD